MRSPVPKLLLIPYGNPLRGDDGTGWRVADELAGEGVDENCSIRPMHQLTPEMAEDISHAKVVIFVDASSEGEPGDINCHPLKPCTTGEMFNYHNMTPSRLLGLSLKLYGQCPKAFLLTLTGENFSFGDDLSPTCARMLPELIRRVRELIDNQIHAQKPGLNIREV